jgi:ketosteroid isomerase-like protein
MEGNMGINSINLIDLVKRFLERVNQHDVEKIMTMYTEDVTFEVVGYSKVAGKQQVKIIFENYSGKQQVKKHHEFQVSVNSNFKFLNGQSEGNTVHCQISQHDDTLDAKGFSGRSKSSCIFTFKDGLIQSVAVEIPPDYIEQNSKILKTLIPWFTEKYPNEYARMFMPDGRFIYNRENGRDVVPLLRKWSEEQKAKE